MIRLRRSSSPVQLLVLQPTPFCNLACDYCYLPDRSNKGRMSLETLECIFARLREDGLIGRTLSVVWHAGEPLAVPASFYRSACDLIRSAVGERVEVRHSVQTNGTLIDCEWCALFSERSFNVGVSLDGPAFLHDRHRKTRSGRGTHADVMRGIRLLRESGVPFHVICVLTREALDQPDALFDFFLEEGMHQVGFNVEELEGVHAHSSLEASGAEIAMQRFMRRILERVVESDHALAIRELDEIIDCLATGPRRPRGGNAQTNPLQILSIDHSGAFSTFSPELLGMRSERYGDFRFGDVRRNSLRSLASNPLFERVRHDVAAGVRRCRTGCEYFRVCGGGAPANKLFETGSFAATETLYCRLTRKAVTDALLDWSEDRGATIDWRSQRIARARAGR